MFKRFRATLLASLVLFTMAGITPAHADHQTSHWWYHQQNQAGGAPYIDRTGRPDLAQYAAESLYAASNGRLIHWVAAQEGDTRNCAAVYGAVVFCRDASIPVGTPAVSDYGYNNQRMAFCVIRVALHTYGGQGWYPGKENLAYLHEAGHCAGLQGGSVVGHTADTSSVMYYLLSPSRPSFSQHDRDALDVMYRISYDI